MTMYRFRDAIATCKIKYSIADFNCQLTPLGWLAKRALPVGASLNVYDDEASFTTLRIIIYSK